MDRIPQYGSLGRRAFTIIEIMVAVIIISILTLILTPTLSNRAKEARIAAADFDLKELAQAQERVAIDTGYFLRPYVLNDVPGGDGIANAAANDQINGLSDNAVVTNNPYTDPSKIFISPSTQDFVTNQTVIFQRMLRDETDFNIKAPYVNWRRDSNENDWPDDPWGNDYWFFTRNGYLAPVDNLTGLPDRSNEFQAESTFDRPAFVSLGPDGLFGTTDDLVYKFAGGR